MAYTKQNFVNGQKLTAEQLNHMEAGIYSNSINTGSGGSGYTPVRGVDYWTAADIAEIKSYVDDAILGGSW